MMIEVMIIIHLNLYRIERRYNRTTFGIKMYLHNNFEIFADGNDVVFRKIIASIKTYGFRMTDILKNSDSFDKTL